MANTFSCVFLSEHNYDTHAVTLLQPGFLFYPNIVSLSIMNNKQNWEKKKEETLKSQTIFALEMMNN